MRCHVSQPIMAGSTRVVSSPLPETSLLALSCNKAERERYFAFGESLQRGKIADAAFRQFEITKSSAASSSAAHATEIESHRLSLLWIMNPVPQPAAGITPVGCGAEANASCNCGVSYVAKSVRAAEAIKENPGKSDWAIAAELGIGSNTVRRAREDSGAPCGAGEERIGRDGKSYSIRQRIREEAGPLASPRAARRVSLTVCELRHITLPRIVLFCQRFLPDWGPSPMAGSF
jgi:hypothetical protein